jgi:hypothetical protein
MDTMIACDHTGCTAQYRRKEHLNRHARKHYPATQLTCELCGKTFDRSDTLRRHRQLHLRDGRESMPRAARACDCCHASKTRCDGKEPCNVCSRRGLRCTFNRWPKQALVGDAATSKLMSEPEVQTSRTSVDYQEHERSERSERPLIPGASKEVQTLLLQHENYLRETTLLTRTERNGEGDQGQLDIDYHVEIYFAHFHSQWPIIHKPSFHLSKDSQPHVLILSFAMIGLWVTGGRAARTRAKNMHEKLVTLLESRMVSSLNLSQSIGLRNYSHMRRETGSRRKTSRIHHGRCRHSKPSF